MEGFTQGASIDDSDPQRLAAALDYAVDFRGDVTLRLLDGREVEGYLFDRARTPAPGVRLLARDSNERLSIADAEIAVLVISGKDAAAGKSFEGWIRRYAEQKRRGEAAGIESEPL